MRVAMYYRNNDIRVEELPVPEIADDEVLVKVFASGICGSDVMEWYRLHKAPLVLGHEIAGEIVETGRNVQDYKVGDRIAAAHHVPCDECHYCRSGHSTVCDTLRTTNYDPGGFSEYLRLPGINVQKGIFKIPAEMSYDEATFVEPLACILRGQRQARIKKGDDVLVLGSGISGLLHIQLAKVNGANKVFATDVNDYRLNAAAKFGADLTIDALENIPEKIREYNNGKLADVVILCAGAEEALNQALSCVERAGTLLFFAPARSDETKLPVALNELFWRNEITLTSSYAGSPQDHHEALDLIKNKAVDVQGMVTHKLPLAQTQYGFELVVRANDSIKVIIEPNK